ncbi:MAG: bifunctional phosphopantothenoylcysteine decarboxylase/phosphopantothenate--cysteine ligase CoaBC [Alphaproteobacteria bacterium]
MDKTNEWAVAEAKNRFSELVTKALNEGPQRIRRRDETAVVLSEAEYDALCGAPQAESARPLLSGRRVLLIIGGGIAAYKGLELVRQLAKRGIASRAILTAAGSQFVTPLSLGALTGDKVYQELFSLTDEAEMGHIELSRSADLIVVAPATADLIAKAANGLASDLATTTLLATDKPVLMAPAMNVRMWMHAATQRNIETLQRDGVRFIGPDDGEMACGEFGPGRMAEPEAIAAMIEDFYAAREIGTPLAGKKIIVTAGPTLEALDPVRFISNKSSGKQGYAIADSLARLGADVALISGPTALAAPPNVRITRVESAAQMLAACEAALPVDAAVCVAAVADWRPDQRAELKIKKVAGKATPSIALLENPDILATLSKAGGQRPKLVVGFAAETNNVEENATAKRERKGCDWIVANDVSGDVMGGDENEVALVTASGVEHWPRMRKAQAADKLAAAIATALA